MKQSDSADGAYQGSNRIVTVDYDRYARGEAVLGWLNAVIHLTWFSNSRVDWEEFIRHLFSLLQNRLQKKQSAIGHIKVLLDCGGVRIVANLTGLCGQVDVEVDGILDEPVASLTINARVQVTPEDIEFVFRNTPSDASVSRVAPEIRSFHCIKPGRPQPTYRYA